MKSSLTYALVSILGASTVAAECIEGHREVISPTYTVEYKCGVYKQGTTHNGIPSVNECAALCESVGIDICSYHAPSKRCIVSKPDGKDLPREGVYYLSKVEEEDEDPFKEDPFTEDPIAERDACLVREASLKADLASCHADAAKAEAAKSGPRCGAKGISNANRIEVEKLPGTAACKAKCLRNPKCKAYSAGDDPAAWCYIFDEPHSGDTPGYPHMRSYDRDC
ncbi:hypothetical protein FSARC_8559 [Fusarium sarcochroum]|uniref:Apple domain-containing protein n=1 Tax=Fusarium sarcochroum TaxID=1208366 RepID=A0A8H4TSN2_9HYPO|nr:hypothetical protein FSARC_8559 [Fusarium sarcochroum]